MIVGLRGLVEESGQAVEDQGEAEVEVGVRGLATLLDLVGDDFGEVGELIGGDLGQKLRRGLG